MTRTSSLPNARGPYAKSDATRTAILDAALSVFGESGYRSGSLREVASRAGLSEAGLLHHFRNKPALLLAALDRRDELALPLAGDPVADPLRFVRSLVEIVHANAQTPGVVELYATLSGEATASDHPAHDWFQQRYAELRSQLGLAFSGLAALGRLNPAISPDEASTLTIAVMDGLQVQWLLSPDDVDMGARLDALLNTLLITGASD